MEGDAGSGQLTPTPPLEADETVVDDAGLNVPTSRLATSRWLTGVCAAIVIAALLLTTAGVLALLGHRKTSAAINGEAVAVAAAKDCIAATQAPDVKVMAESRRKIVQCATDNYAPQANMYAGLLTDAYEAAKAQVKISDIRAAPEKHNPDGSIDVLVATRVLMSNIDQQNQELSYRLRVRMQKVGDTYKIDSIEPVSK